MNTLLRQFERESKLEIFGLGARRDIWERALEKYAELIVQGIAVLSGLVLFLALNRSEPVNQFMTEVVVELSRVSWPTQKESRASTVLVVIMVVVSGLFLGLMDYLWTVILKWLI